MSKLIPFLLVVPDLCLPGTNGKFDSYMVLLAYLIGKKSLELRGGNGGSDSNSIRYNRNAIIFICCISVFLIFTMLSQAIMAEQYNLSTHVVGQAGRFDENLSWGDGIFVVKELAKLTNIRIITLLLFFMLLFFYLNNLTVGQRAIFFYRMIVFCAAFQLFYLILYYSNMLPIFSKIFMQERSELFSENVQFRLGLIRIPGGFSEPSFMCSMMFSAITALYGLVLQSKIDLTNYQRILLGGAIITITLTTASMMVLFVFLFYIINFTFLYKKLTPNIIGIGVLTVALLLQLFPILFIAENVPQGLESISQRQFLTTPIEAITTGSIFFGYAIGEVYNFPFFNNLIIQVGLVGFLFLIISFSLLRGMFLYFMACFILFISVVPSFSYSFLYVTLAMFLGSALGVESDKRGRYA